MAQLEAAMRPETVLVSIMSVNNEIGVVQPIEEIGKLCRSRKIFFHTDAAQAVGKIPMDVNKMNIDLMSISGHKIYGPKGVGACYVRRRPRVRLEPIISGGGQERGLRSGTLAPPLAIGFGEAARVCKEEMQVRFLYTFLPVFICTMIIRFIHAWLSERQVVSNCGRALLRMRTRMTNATVTSFINAALIGTPLTALSMTPSASRRCRTVSLMAFSPWNIPP